MKTLDFAIGLATTGTVIVLTTGHKETIDQVDVPAGTTIVGEGVSGGIPSVELTPSDSAAVADDLVLLKAGASIRNVRFKSNGVSGAYAKIRSESYNVVSGCRFDCSGLDTGTAIVISSLTGVVLTVEDCVFVSTATAAATLPGSAIRVDTEPQMLRLVRCSFDDGLYGFSSDYAVLTSYTINCDHFSCEETSLVRGASIMLDDPGVSGGVLQGFVSIATATGGGRVTG